MGPYSAEVIVKALEGLNARMTATAENIANGNTPNYRPLRVTFEAALARAAAMGDAAVAAVKPEITRVAADGGELGSRLDLELATDNATALRYSALVEVLNRQFDLQRLAASGNA